MSGKARPGRSTMIATRDIHPGDIVNVHGLRQRGSCIVHVTAVRVDELVTIAGRRPWGGGWRVVQRELLPQQRAELLTEDNDPHEGTR